MKRWLLVALAGWACAAPAEDDFSGLPAVQSFVEEMHEQHGFSSAELLAEFRQARKSDAVIKAIETEAHPAVRSWRKYRGQFIEPKRIVLGREFAEQNRTALVKAEQTYGVPAEIIVAIIGVESFYGHQTGRFSTFSALATLAFYGSPRAELFRSELEALLLLAREQRRDPFTYQGSYAGAIGMPQFLPSSVRNWGVDFDDDERIDLSHDSADAIGSVAHFLAEHGWQHDGPVLYPVTASGERIPVLLAEGINPKRLPAELSEFGVTATSAPQENAALIELVTPDQPTEYRLGFNNFYVLTRYNRSSFYATAVYDLATALKPSSVALQK